MLMSQQLLFFTSKIKYYDRRLLHMTQCLYIIIIIIIIIIISLLVSPFIHKVHSVTLTNTENKRKDTNYILYI